jgi:hypothetical protein
MVRHSIDDPAYWHERAKEARGVAEQMRATDSKAAMLKIADSYDQLGRNAARRAALGGKGT